MNHEEWQRENQRPGNEQRNYPSQGNGGSNTRLVLRVIIMICSLISLFAAIGRYRDRRHRVARYEYPQLMRETPEEPTVPYLAFDDINEIAEYSPLDTAFIRRSTRITSMHLPAIVQSGDSALSRTFRYYSNLAQARSLYLQIQQLSMDVVKLCVSPIPLDSTDQKTVRRLTRLGKEYNYDVNKRAGGAIFKNPMLQKINPDATSFNQRVIRLLERSNETLAYLNECVQKNQQPEAGKLSTLTKALDKARISGDAFESRDKRLRQFMNALGAELVQNAQIKNGAARRTMY